MGAGRRRNAGACALLLLAPGVSACQLLFPTETEPPPTADAGKPTVPTDTLDASSWELYSLGFSPPNYAGGAFDGRYVYLSPTTAGPVARYDTHGPFGKSTSWDSFNAATVDDAGAASFAGAIFDGRYVYMIGDQYRGGHNLFVRYDARLPFHQAGSWVSFDVATRVNTKAQAYYSGTFDGRYLYLAPATTGYVLQYDTHGSFTAPGSWVGFDLAKTTGRAIGFQGALYDGRYVYLVPDLQFRDAGDVASGLVVRHDTTQPFDSGPSWDTFDVSSIDPSAVGFIGGAFDGRYLYLPAEYNYAGLVARYDTKGSGLSDASSWQFFSGQKLSVGAGGYAGAAFDGRYVYFVPAYDSGGSASGLLLRYDTQGPFDAKASWSDFDMTQLIQSANTYWGAVFDGENVYFVPNGTGVATRLHSRTSPRAPHPPLFPASFF